MTNDHSFWPDLGTPGLCQLNGREVFWTGRVAIGLRFEAPTPQCTDTLPVMLSLLLYELEELLHV
jgi:hypothetical protein